MSWPEPQAAVAFEGERLTSELGMGEPGLDWQGAMQELPFDRLPPVTLRATCLFGLRKRKATEAGRKQNFLS
jgi:hypothetical protein